MFVIFLGTPEIAQTVLESLISSGYPIHSVVTRPDQAVGRSSQLQKSPVKITAKQNNLDIFQPKTKIELEEYVVRENPDILIVTAFGMIVTKPTLEAARLGAINVHPSLLPKYRGPAPIVGPILAGDTETGTTIMLMSEGMDEGDILVQEKYSLNGKEDAESLIKILAALSVKLLIKTIPPYLAGEIKPKSQNNAEATYTKMVKKEDGQINWTTDTAKIIERKSRAYVPWPGVYATWNDRKLELKSIEIGSEQIETGRVALQNGRLIIGTIKGTLIPGRLKIEGKNLVSAADFLRGYPNILNTILK